MAAALICDFPIWSVMPLPADVNRDIFAVGLGLILLQIVGAVTCLE